MHNWDLFGELTQMLFVRKYWMPNMSSIITFQNKACLSSFPRTGLLVFAKGTLSSISSIFSLFFATSMFCIFHCLSSPNRRLSS